MRATFEFDSTERQTRRMCCMCVLFERVIYSIMLLMVMVGYGCVSVLQEVRAGMKGSEYGSNV